MEHQNDYMGALSSPRQPVHLVGLEQSPTVPIELISPRRRTFSVPEWMTVDGDVGLDAEALARASLTNAAS